MLKKNLLVSNQDTRIGWELFLSLLGSSSTSTFAEVRLPTKFGSFNFRVYNNPLGKEIIVLWTDNIKNSSNQPLVRIHSECMTGDLFGSCKCDCGKQLEKSLKMIAENGGVLIYLRQEGRGIGLFEKIRAYKLQEEGLDTFQANVILGHPPDDRSYELAVVALNDLGIDKIRLITNNPSKISEISKLGITVIEQVPIYVRPNKFNKSYLKTKKSKFQHCFKGVTQKYFYQFHVDGAADVSDICRGIKLRIKDPQQMLLAGVSANDFVVNSSDFTHKLRSIYEECKKYEVALCLHYSCRVDEDVIKTLRDLRNKFPFLTRLHLNDLDQIKPEFLKKACEYFEIYLPVSDDQFEIFDNRKILTLIRKNNICILLDNSKGKGLKEPLDSFKKKIEILLECGIRNIALCGGFGPDELSGYFELRRYFKINFSIDAESKLKIEGIVSKEKTITYLKQLLRFDDPNFRGLTQTKKILDESNPEEVTNVFVDEHKFLVYPDVFNPKIFPSTRWYADQLIQYVGNHKCSFCEVGCGSGLISCLVAINNPRCSVVATDVSHEASRNTLENVQRLRIDDQIQVFNGDVFDGIQSQVKFDFIFWAMPFGFLDPGTIINQREQQVFDPGYRGISKFLREAKNYLLPKGKILYGFSEDLGNTRLMRELLDENCLESKLVRSTQLKESKFIELQLFEASYR